MSEYGTRREWKCNLKRASRFFSLRKKNFAATYACANNFFLIRFPFESLISWQTFACSKNSIVIEKLSTWLQTRNKFKNRKKSQDGRGERGEEKKKRKIMLKRQSITDVEWSINTECTVITLSSVNESNLVDVRLLCVFMLRSGFVVLILKISPKKKKIKAEKAPSLLRAYSLTLAVSHCPFNRDCTFCSSWYQQF